MIAYDGKYFNVKDTLECGQIFRFCNYRDGYLVFSTDKACFAYNRGDTAYIECEPCDEEYFRRFFDLDRDYSLIYDRCKSSGYAFVAAAARAGKGIRILNQDERETLISFLISQNNRIPRIKSIIERTCEKYGEVKSFDGVEYNAFPLVDAMPSESDDDYVGLGYGYRAQFVRLAATSLKDGTLKLDSLKNLDTPTLKRRLTEIKGVGPKVADCTALFAYHRTDSFPVDTWIEKVYREDFNGVETNRKKITAFLEKKFGEDSGYVQQYVFHYKRNLI